MLFVRLARAVHRHRRAVVAAWAAVLLAGVVLGGQVFGRLDDEGPEAPASAESVIAARRLSALDPSGETIYALADGRSLDDPALRASVTGAAEDVRRLPGVAGVLDHYSSGVPQLAATDGRATVVVVEMEPGAGDGAFAAVAERLRAVDAPRVVVGGGPLLDEEFGAQAEADLLRADLLSFPVLLVGLFVVFGGVVAAGLPLLVAFAAVAGTLLVLFGVSSLTDVSVYAINVVTMLALGLASTTPSWW